MKVLIATGGTGGHIFPALAIGQELQTQGHDVVFVGSGRPLDRQVEAQSGLRWRHLNVGRFKGMGLLNKLLALLWLPVSCVQALGILIAEKPHCVIGVGGASTGPMVLMARFVSIKTAILENNRIPGMTNRILSHLVNRIFIAMPVTPYFQSVRRKLRLTGNPIRRSVIEQFKGTHKNGQRFTLLVLGGSQGAHALNQLMVELTPQLEDLAEQLEIIHITGKADCDWVSQHYAENPQLKSTVLPFTDDLGLYYKQADVVLSRAGASTVADLIHFGRPSVLVPYPFAADEHQEANARYLADAGAALLEPQDAMKATEFAGRLRVWIKDQSPLEAMARKVQQLAPTQSAQDIVKECEELVTGRV